MSQPFEPSDSRLAKFRQRWSALVGSLRPPSASSPSPVDATVTAPAVALESVALESVALESVALESVALESVALESSENLGELSTDLGLPVPALPDSVLMVDQQSPSVAEALPVEQPAEQASPVENLGKPSRRSQKSANKRPKKSKVTSKQNILLPSPAGSLPSPPKITSEPAVLLPPLDLSLSPEVSLPPFISVTSTPALRSVEPPIVDTVDFSDVDFFAIFIEEVEGHLPKIRHGLTELVAFNFAILPDLYRSFHTLKGAFGQIGALRGRALFHTLESLTEDIELAIDDQDRRTQVKQKFPLLQAVWDAVETLIEGLQQRVFTPIPSLPASVLEVLSPALLQTLAVEKEASQSLASSLSETAGVLVESALSDSDLSSSSASPKAIIEEQFVRLSTNYLEKVLAKLSTVKATNLTVQNKLQDSLGLLRSLDDTGDKLSHLLREFEIYTDYRLQYLNDASQVGGSDLDPLEFERFNRFQELTKFITEGVSDFVQVKRDLQQLLASQEIVLLSQQETTEEIHHGFIDVRLVSISHMLRDSLARTVRQASTELNKSVDFTFKDSDLEADKILLEKLSAPLAHLLRNSLTHGIEDEPTRLALHKSSAGKIAVVFSQVGEQIQVVISDDGAGLNLEAIKNKAVAKGLWNPHHAMDVAQAADIICTSGFSTAVSVSELAGRGVGMDVVRNAVLELGGQFTLSSEPHRGTEVTILVPLTFSSLRGMVVTVAACHYFIPAKSIAWLDSLPADALQLFRQQRKLSHLRSIWGASSLPSDPASVAQVSWEFSSLATRVGLVTPSSRLVLNNSSAPPSPSFVLGFEEAGRRLAVEVDSISPLQDLPLYSLGKLWSSFPGILGTTILPNGELVYVLDVLHLASGSPLGKTAPAGLSASPVVSPPSVNPILVVDDSLTVRTHLERLLSTYEFPTVLTQDGVEALDYLQSHPHNLPKAIILDVEMPRMDGFELVRQLKASSLFKAIPLIMVTSKVSPKHHDYGLSLGIVAYLGKPVKKSELLPILDNLVFL